MATLKTTVQRVPKMLQFDVDPLNEGWVSWVAPVFPLRRLKLIGLFVRFI